MIEHTSQVLDDGFVRIIDTMGDDQRIVDSARISYGAATRHIRGNEGLIRYLMRKHHTSPFEQCEIVMVVRCPIDVARQWFRHRTWSYNEYSTRYSEAIDSCQRTAPGAWRLQGERNKQGSEGFLNLVDGKELTRRENATLDDIRNVYQMRLDKGVAREQARKDLPMSTYTEFYGKVDLHNLFHFLALRMDDHAQEEIRDYANAIAEFVTDWVPLAWKAFVDYRRNAMALSARDIQIIKLSNWRPAGERQTLFREYMTDWGWVKDGKLNQRSGELHECIEKLHRLDLAVPLPWHFVFPQ